MCLVSEESRLESLNNNGILWLNVQKPSYADMNSLEQKYPFHRLNLEDCLSKIQIPKIDRYEDHVFVILHFPTPDKEKGFLFSQLSVFMGADYLVTIHHGDLKPLEELFQNCKNDERQRQVTMGKSTGYLLHKIIDVLVDDLLHILMKVVGNIDDIEDSVFDERISIPRQISLLRREITTLRRIVIPLRRTVVDLTKDVQRFSKEELALYFKDVQDHIEKIFEALEEARETVEIYKDTDFMLSQEKTNKILAVLTIVFTLSIPATVIGTFYGMNVNLPGGTETGVWEQLGPYTTLVFVLAISAVAALFMVLNFRRLGWLGPSM
ncbi:MAG: magnesium transporter CorA family protein [Nitrososphaera sp.]